jgi:hypothetical protein
MDKFEKPFEFITQFIRSLLPKAELTRANVEHLRVENEGAREILTFGIARLEDLETVLGGWMFCLSPISGRDQRS